VTDEQRNARFALAVLFGINLMNFFDRQIAGRSPVRCSSRSASSSA
jgi:hypothetical protein